MTSARGRAAKAVTLAQVAAVAGVSPATASFVLSGRDGRASAGSDATKRKVREAAEHLGYVPNRYARAMRTGRSDAVVLALGTIGDPWVVSLTRAVRGRASPRGLSTVVLADESWYEFLTGYASDCAFVTGADLDPEGQAKIARLARSGIGVVAFGSDLEPDGFDVVTSSSLQAARDAYDLLASRHENVAYLATSAPDVAEGVRTVTRSQALVRHAQDRGRADTLTVQIAEQGHGRSIESCLAWLASPERPEAVVCATGYLAIAMQVAAVRLGISIPDDLELVSIGDVPGDAQFFEPVSYYGVDRVFDRIAGIVVDRAITPLDGDGVRHVLDWRYFAGATTRDD